MGKKANEVDGKPYSISFEWKDLNAITKNLHELLNSKLAPAIGKSASYEGLEKIFSTIEFQSTNLQESKINIVVAGLQGIGKSELINRMLCGDMFVTDSQATKPLPSHAGGSSVTQCSIAIKYASEFSLRTTYREKQDLQKILEAHKSDFDFTPSELLPSDINADSKTFSTKITMVYECLKNLQFTTVQKLGLMRLELSGPFPNLPQTIILIDTPGFGHLSNSESLVENDREVLMREFSTAHVIFAVTPRVIDPTSLELFFKYNAFQERADGSVPLLVSVYYENSIEDSKGDRDVLARSIAAADSTTLPASLSTTDIYAHHRVFHFLTKYSMVFQRRYYTTHKEELHNKLDEIHRIVKRAEVEEFTQHVNMFLASCVAAVRGCPVILSKFEQEFSRVQSEVQGRVWPHLVEKKRKSSSTEVHLAQETFSQSLENAVAYDDLDSTESLQRCVTVIYREHLEQIMDVTYKYLRDVISQFSSAYDKVATPTSRESRSTFRWFMDILHGDDIGGKKNESIVFKDSFWISKYITEKMFQSQDIVVNSVSNTFAAIQKDKSAVHKLVEAIFSSSKYESIIVGLETMANETLKSFITYLMVLNNHKDESFTEEAQRSLLHSLKSIRFDWKNQIKKKSKLEPTKIHTARDPLPKSIAWEVIRKAMSDKILSSKTRSPRETPSSPPSNPLIPVKVQFHAEDKPKMEKIIRVGMSATGEMSVHVSAKAHEFFLKFPTDPKLLLKQRFLYPVFIVSWVKEASELSRLPLLTHNFDDLPRITFVIIEQSMVDMYAQHIFTKTGHVYLVCVAKQHATTEMSLQICKSLAEAFNFTFWWRIPPGIESMQEYTPSNLSSQKCTISRALLYGQLVLGSIYTNIFSTISTKLKGIMFRVLMLLSKLSNSHKVDISPEDSKKTFACLEILEEIESQESFKDDTTITLVNYLISLLALPQCAEQEKDKEKIGKIQKELKDCSDYLALLFSCNVLSYVAQSYQHRALLIHYPNHFNIVSHRKNLDITLNFTMAQKDTSFISSSPTTAWAATQEHTDLQAFENSIKNTEEMIAKKLATTGHSAISLVWFAKPTNTKNTSNNNGSTITNNNTTKEKTTNVSEANNTTNKNETTNQDTNFTATTTGSKNTPKKQKIVQ